MRIIPTTLTGPEITAIELSTHERVTLTNLFRALVRSKILLTDDEFAISVEFLNALDRRES